jgi:hypothetical protein
MVLLARFREDRDAGRPASKFRYLPTDELAERLGVEQQSVRQNVSRLRRTLAEQFLQHCGATIDEQDIVEAPGWVGYRLNPHLDERTVAFVLDTGGARAAMSRNSERNVTTHQQRD